MNVYKLSVSIFLILLIAISVFSQKNGATQKEEEISQCKVRLKVEFLKTDKIGNVSLISKTCEDKSLELDAMEAAKKIEFESNFENGKKVTINKIVEFNYTVYDKDVGTIQDSDFEDYKDVLVFARSYKPLKILYKLRPAYPNYNGGTISVQGTVTLRVQFLSTGEIGEIQPVSRLGYGLTEKAIEAARKMKFSPLITNGIPTTVTRSVQFAFTLY